MNPCTRLRGLPPALLLCVSITLLAQDSWQELFRRHDRNGEGTLTRDEFPERMRGLFDRIDANGSGEITPDEDAAFRRAQHASPGGRRKRPQLPLPTYRNVPYGSHTRQVFDFWMADAPSPTPLVVYYHGGGFRGGDKQTLDRQLLEKLLGQGISVAAVNYRLTDEGPFPMQMQDCARALQSIRHDAERYCIDPTRIGATGGSAGAGISLWLAFHDDLSDPGAEDLRARQSTRLTTAVVYAAQSSYDPRFIQKLFNTKHVDGALLPFYGMKQPEDVDDPRFHALFTDASAINHATADDPPVMLFYPQNNTPLPENSEGRQHIHHPKFGIVLKEKLDALGVECLLKFREDYGNLHSTRLPVDDYVDFFVKHLGRTPPKKSAQTSRSGRP